jgi:hypothetical protein
LKKKKLGFVIQRAMFFAEGLSNSRIWERGAGGCPISLITQRVQGNPARCPRSKCFALPGGFLFVEQGLLEEVDDEAQRA